LAKVRARDLLKFFDPLEFLLEGPVIGERGSIHDLHRAHGIGGNPARQPYLAISASAYALE
jgi:hypothetical protein